MSSADRSKTQSCHISYTFAVGQLPNIGGEAFDSGLCIGLLIESSVDFDQHPVSDVPQLLVRQDKFRASLFDLINTNDNEIETTSNHIFFD